MIRALQILVLCFFCYNASTAQCTTLGQNPSTAFPVCGTTTFVQNTVPICSSVNLFVPGCSGIGNTDYENKNPFWYKFTCFQGGTLGFLITPNNSNDDYDWQLYDITDHEPNDIYTNVSLIVTGNWAGTYGSTGASSAGVNFIQCASDPGDNENSFAQMPILIEGHEYLLLVSHFTDTQSGYGLSFGGGTANITDPTLPKLATSTANCDGTVISVRLNKKMKCSSLTTSGGNMEFFITPSVANVIQATGNGCNVGFDMDVVQIRLDNPLPPGNYFVKIKNGADGNTLLDNCDRTVPEGDSIPLTIAALEPTPMDSLRRPGCAPQILELVFDKPIRCSSVNPNGSDFIVTGTYPVTVTAASGECVNGVSSKIFVQLSAPLNLAGNFQVILRSGPDGNTIIDECGQVTLPDTLSFVTKDTVSADFTYDISLGCQIDTIKYFHPTSNGVNFWLWNFDNGESSNLQNPETYYTIFGKKQTRLIFSNGTCSDTSLVTILLNNTLTATFEASYFICPNEKVIFKDHSVGNIVNWNWDFQNGTISSLQNPPPQTYVPASDNYLAPVQLIVEDDLGCKDTISREILIIDNCYIAVPSAFTPNGDGLNDFLYPLNAYKAGNLRFSIYNRFGQLIFSSEDWTKKWDGKFKGQGADPGTYVWTLSFTHIETKKRVEQKGYTVLIR